MRKSARRSSHRRLLSRVVAHEFRLSSNRFRARISGRGYMVDFISYVRDHYETLPERFAILDLVGGVQRPLASRIGDD